MSVTVILPVYGHSPWLKEAMDSVLNQKSNDWKLLIADDGSDKITREWLQSQISALKDPRILWVRRPNNLGLFSNVNHAIMESNTGWVVLLCSDDKLHKHAIQSLQALRKDWPEADLIISSFESINADGSDRPAVSAYHHNELRKTTGLVQPKQMLPELLRLGSLNGNLSGMAFSKEHWQKVGPFREDWSHAADWEWLVRASESKPLLLNRSPLALVRTHTQQLSVRNRKSGHECREVADVVRTLVEHPLLQRTPERHRWAGHVMQFQLWNLIKAASQGDYSQLADGLKAIHNSAGLRQTGVSLLKWLPKRSQKWRNQTSEQDGQLSIK